MPKNEEELHKHTLNLFEGDYDKIASLYPDVGAAVVIRKIIRDFINRVEKAAEGHAPSVEIDL